MTERDRFEEFVRSAINEVDPAPPVPRDEMWARIADARRFQRSRTPDRKLTWIAWPLGLAATLALGIGIGRVSVARQTVPAVSAPATVAAAPTGQAGDLIDSAYRVAAVEHLSRAEVLLTSVSSGTIDPQVIRWSKEMLTTTRLMLDSPGGSDPRIRQLLEDLELLLTQIAVSNTGGRRQSELDLIQHGIEQTDVLPRLRAVQPGNSRTVGT